MRPGCPLVANAIVFASLSALATGGCRGGLPPAPSFDRPAPVADTDGGVPQPALGGPPPAPAPAGPPPRIYGGEVRIDVSLRRAKRQRRRAHAFQARAARGRNI